LLFGPDERLYVNSTNTNEILRYDFETGAFLDVYIITGGVNEEQMRQPGLVFRPLPRPAPPGVMPSEEGGDSQRQ
jgi:hypothetical protein